MIHEFRMTQNMLEPHSPLRIPVDRPGIVNVYAWPDGDVAHLQGFFNPDLPASDSPADAQMTIKDMF